MTEDQGKVRALRAVRPAAPSESPESAASILPGLPRVGALDALLREVDGLRLSLETDLSLAASAVEAGSVGIARDIIDSDIAGLHRFESSALDQLAELSDADAAEDHGASAAWWRRVPKTPFAAAASVVVFLLLAVPSGNHGPSDIDAANVSASERLQQISLLASSGQTSQIRDAAVSLHGQLLKLIAQAKTDPVAAQRGLQLLSDERSIIALSGDSAALRDVLADSANLSNLIISQLPAAIRPTVRTVRPLIVTSTSAPSSRPTARPTSSPSSKPSATPSATPSPKPTSSSTASPHPSPSSGTPVLPTGPGLR
ncbi:MAG: hypothetical protein JWO12_448 [Frankiales bacterium]|nr:hypothetical protein [Frankiales bacterium]